MAIRQISNKDVDGTVIGQSTSDLLGFYGTATPVDQGAAVTTVDTTTITTVDTTTITAVTAGSTLTAVRTWAIAANIDLQLQAETINKLVADSRANALANNRTISRLQDLNLIA